MRVLESQGMVQADGRGGFRVADQNNLLRHALGLLVGIERVEVAHLFEVRKTLEVETAGLAAARRSASDLSAMAVRIDQMEAGLQDPARYNQADIGFHFDLASATGNRLTVRLMDAIADAMSKTFAVSFHLPGNPQQSLDEHRGIYGAVAGQDPRGARERMRAHLQRVEDQTIGYPWAMKAGAQFGGVGL